MTRLLKIKNKIMPELYWHFLPFGFEKYEMLTTQEMEVSLIKHLITFSSPTTLDSINFTLDLINERNEKEAIVRKEKWYRENSPLFFDHKGILYSCKHQTHSPSPAKKPNFAFDVYFVESFPDFQNLEISEYTRALTLDDLKIPKSAINEEEYDECFLDEE